MAVTSQETSIWAKPGPSYSLSGGRSYLEAAFVSHLVRGVEAKQDL